MATLRTLAFAALLAAACFVAAPAHGQEAQPSATPAVVKKVKFLAWAKKNHLNYYIAGYSAVMAALAGISIAGLSYRYSERSKLYKVAKVRTTAWAVALGLGIGVAVAVMQVPSAQQGKSRSMIISVTIASLLTPVITYGSFVAFRSIHIRRVGKRGRRSSERMDLL